MGRQKRDKARENGVQVQALIYEVLIMSRQGSSWMEVSRKYYKASEPIKERTIVFKKDNKEYNKHITLVK